MKKEYTLPLLIIIGIPVLYGLIYRLWLDSEFLSAFVTVMSIGFLVGMPFGIGVLTMVFSPVEKVRSYRYQVFMPWLGIGVLLVITLLLKWEGWACWIMALPIFLLISSFGGITAGYFKLKKHDKSNRLNVSLALLLPFLIAPIEKSLNIPPTTFTAYTYIDVTAPDSIIWQHVVRVKEISAQEDHGTLTNFMGFPRPIKAELNVAAVGGTRKAIFSKGLVFTEEVLAYRPQQYMHFSIKANPYDIPSTTMDKHIVIGGDYFNVLDGTYSLQHLRGNVYRLHLYSHFVLKTSFNFYAGWWGKWIMKDIQNNILHVIKTRCEINR